MTTFDKTSLQALWINGFVPQGSDYTNLIASQVNIAETTAQAMAGPLSMTKLITPIISATNANITTKISAAAINVAGDVSAATGTVYASAVRTTVGTIVNSIPIVSAAGTALATATSFTAHITRGQGVTDGQATGFKLPVPTVGWKQYFICEAPTSCNMWPAGGDYVINGLASGAAFAMAANTTYLIIHKTTSAYAVK